MPTLGRPRRHEARGQILVLFVISLVAMLSMSALLFDAAQALVLKRQLQDAGDAAALAAANQIQVGTPRGCSATAGPPPGAPRSSLVTAAQNAVTAILPGFDTSKITVTCPGGWAKNYAVQVSLGGNSPSFFGGVIGLHGFGVGATSQAVNGQTTILKYSVVTLDNANPSWPNGYRGCPSVLLSGGPTVVLDGSMQIDSACSASNGGALATNGNAANLSFNNGSVIRMVGGYAPGPLTISPTPMTGQNYVSDPLASSLAVGVPVSSLPVRSTSRLTLSGSSTVLQPGVYTGGILMKNSAVALLAPGIYVMNGGGFTMGAQNAVYTVAAGVTSTSDTGWTSGTDCPDSSCGVLIYNTGTTTTMGQVQVGAGATLRLKPYWPEADVENTPLGATYQAATLAFRNLLFWQSASPAPSGTYNQPVLQLNGGGTVTMSGTVYAPSAITQMGGGSGGSGGSATNVTLQFIVWDLTFQGNSSFHFYYQSQDFAQPLDYGLIK